MAWYTLIPKQEEFILPIFTPSDLRSNLVHPSLVGKTDHTVPDFSFIDQNGNTVSEKTVQDKIYVVDFFFTSCPSICIDLTNNLNHPELSCNNSKIRERIFTKRRNSATEFLVRKATGSLHLTSYISLPLE